MEAKLAAYRRRKEAEKQAEHSLISKFKIVLTNGLQKSQSQADNNKINNDSSHKNKCAQDLQQQISTTNRKSLQNFDHPEKQECDHFEQPEMTSEVAATDPPPTTTTWLLRMLKCLLWLTLWGLFIELQFGAVFFAVSLLLFVIFNTRTGPRDNKPSAYSVFNKDCERIQGTLTAEQMQKHMFSVPGLPS